MSLDGDTFWQLLNPQDSMVTQPSPQQPPDGDGSMSEHSLIFDVLNNKYRLHLLAIFAVVLTLPLMMIIRNVRHRKEKKERPRSFLSASSDRHPLRVSVRRILPLASSNVTTTDKTGATQSRFRFWNPQTNPSPRQLSAERSKSAISKSSPQPVVTGRTKTAAASPSKHGQTSNSLAVLANASANKTTKVSDGESQMDMAAKVIMLTNGKTQLKPELASRRAQSLDRTANIAGKEGSLSVKNRSKSMSLTQEAGACDVHEANGFSVASKSKHDRGCDCGNCNTEDTGDGKSKLPALAIDKFREINCFRAAECRNSKLSSQNHAGSQVRGYDSKNQSDSQTGTSGHETQVNEQSSGGQSGEGLSQISIEESTKAVKLSLREEQRALIRRHLHNIRDETSRDSRHVQHEQNVKSDSINSDSVMSTNEDVVKKLPGNFCQDYRNMQADNGFDSRMWASGGCRRGKGNVDHAELHEVEANNKSSQRISNGAEMAEHAVQTYGPRLHSKSSCVGSISTSDDHSWSFTRRNPVFEDRYTSFMKVSSLSKRQSSRLRRTIEVEPRPSRKLIVPRSKSEKQRLHSEQWPDEVLHNKDKVPKLACLLLDPDDYLLKNGKQIGAQKVYTKDGFKFIVPLTFVSYGDRTGGSFSLAEQPYNGVGFSLTNLSTDDGCNREVVGANCGNISQMDELGNTSKEHSFEGNLGRSEKWLSTNTCLSSTPLSSIPEETTEQECGPFNCRKHERPGIVETKQCDLRCCQVKAQRNETGTAELLSALQMLNSARQTNETNIRKIARRYDVSRRICREKNEHMNASDRRPNIKDILRKDVNRKEVELSMKHIAQAESMKNVSKWLSDVYSCRSHHSNSSSIANHGLKRQEILARKQSTRIDAVSRKDFTSPESENCHLQGLKKDSQLSHRRLAHKCMTPSIPRSHQTKKRLVWDVKNADGRTTDKATSPHSDSSLSVACSLVKRSFARFMNRQEAYLRANDETYFPREGDYRYNSEVISDLEKDTNGISTKHSKFNNNEIQYHQYHRYLNTDNTKMDNKKPEYFQKPFTKLNTKQVQDHFLCRRFHQNKKSHTDSLGDTSILESIPVSCKSGENLASASPAYTHMPLFKNRHNESVNIIVRLDSSAQKNLMEKHTFGSFLSATATPENSCLPDEPDECCLMRKDRRKSEIPIINSSRSWILKHSDLISGNKDAPMKVFNGQKQLRETTQTNQQTFIDTAVGDSHGQFRLHCAVLSTDHHGVLSVKKFEGNMQEENTIYINDPIESKELEDLANLDLSSVPSSIQLKVKQGFAQGKMTAAAIEDSGTGELKMLYEAKTKGIPTRITGHGSYQRNPKHLSIHKPDDSASCRGIAQKDRTLNTKLLLKLPHQESKLSEHARVIHGNNPEDLAKDWDSGSKIKTTSRARVRQHQAGVLVNCGPQKQEKKIQIENWDIQTQQKSELLGEDEVEVAASNPCVKNTTDRVKIATESHLKTRRMDNASETTSVLARNGVGKSMQVHSDHASKELTEDQKNVIQFPGGDSVKQTNVVTNKQVGFVKQPFNYKRKHLQHSRHLEEQYPDQNTDTDLLNKTKATNAGNVLSVIANTTSRRVDPCDPDRKTLETVPEEETARPNVAIRGQFNEQSHFSKLSYTTGNSDCRRVPQKRQKPQLDTCIARPLKENSSRTQKQHPKLSESTGTKEIDRCGTFTDDLGKRNVSPVLKINYYKKETKTEQLEDIINITYSKENNMPQSSNSSDISLNLQNFPNQKQTYKCDDEDTTETNTQMDKTRCEGKKRRSSNVGLISERQKCKTLAATIQEPNTSFQKPNSQLNDTFDSSPVRKRAVLKKANRKSESPKSATNKSIQFDEKVYFTQCPQTTSTVLSSKQKAEVSLFSQSMAPETDKSFCKASKQSGNSVTFNADKIKKHDGTIRSKAKTMKGKPTKRKPTNIKENENKHETTIRANSKNGLPAGSANISQYGQESNVKHQFARSQSSSHVDSVTSGVDGCTRCKFKKPSNLQHELFKKMFKFCAGEDATYAPEQQAEATSAPRTSQTTKSKTKSHREFNGVVNSRNPNDSWAAKEFPETIEQDKQRENKSGNDGRAGRQHLQTRASKNVKRVNEGTPGNDENSHYFADTYTKRRTQPSVERGKNDEPDILTCTDNVFDETDDCCLPDHLPSKIGGSTEPSNDDNSDLGSPKGDKHLASVDDHKPTCRLNVDELREKYLREMTQKGLCRNRTFRIKDEKNKVHDKDMTVTGSSNQGTFGSDTTIIKSPIIIKSTNMAAKGKTRDVCTPDICHAGSQNSLKRKREGDKYEELNVGKEITSSDNKSLMDLSSSDKCTLKDIPKRKNLTGLDYERLPQTALQNNEVILNSPIGESIKQISCDNMKIYSPQSYIYSPQPKTNSPESKIVTSQSNIFSPHRKISSRQSKMCSPQSKSNVSMKKQCRSRELRRFCSPITQQKPETSQAEHHSDASEFTGLRRQVSLSNSNSPSSTSANIPIMEHSELLSQTLLTSPSPRTKNAVVTHVMSANLPIMEDSELLNQTFLTSPSPRTKNAVVTHVMSANLPIMEDSELLNQTFLTSPSPRTKNAAVTHVMSANLPIMEDSELLNQTFLTSPAHRTRNAGVTRGSSQSEDNHLSTTENYPSQTGQQQHAHQISVSQRPHKFSRRRPSQIPKMKRSQTSSGRLQRSDAQGCSQIRPVLYANLNATNAGHSNSGLETITIRQPKANETHSACQSLNDTNRTGSEKDKHEKEVNNARSPGSSTDVMISWLEKENAHDTYAQESDTEPVFSFHNKPPSTMSHTPSNYTLTTICGFQGDTVPMPNTPCGMEGTADVNKQRDVQELIPSPRRDASRVFDSGKRQENGEQVSESIRPDESPKENLSENINVENLNEKFETSKEDKKIPFWQKGPRPNSMKTGYGADRGGVFGKKATTLRGMEAKHGLIGASRLERNPCKVASLLKELDGKSPAVNREKIGTCSTNLQECELKRPGDTNVGVNSRPRTMRGLAKNRKYVNSALMYTMKKQNVNLPHKPNSGTKQQHGVLKNPALSTNNSAVFDKEDFQLRYQIPKNAHLYNYKAKAAKPSDGTQLQKTVHKNTAASKEYHKTNQNAIYFHQAYQPECKQMRMETVKPESVSGHSLEGCAQGSIDSFNGKPAVKRFELQHSRLSVAVPFCVQRGDAKDTDRVQEYSQDGPNKQEEFEDNGIDGDNTDDQVQTVNTENDRTNGSVCTASDPCKVRFDWYKPLATSAQASGHAVVPVNGHPRRGLFERRITEPDNSVEGSHRRQLFVFNTRTSIGGEGAYGTGLVHGTEPASQVSCGGWDPRNQQEMTQAHIQNLRHTVRPDTTYANRRDSDEETREHRHLSTHDLAQPNMDASGTSLLHRPRCVLPFAVTRHPQNYFQHATMNDSVSSVWADQHKSHPSRRCHASDAAPSISDNRRHYMSNDPYAAPRHHRRPEDPRMRAPAEDASLSNLNALYEHLQQNYNQANAIYHSNWILANQNNSLNDLKATPGQFNCWTNSISNVNDPQYNLLHQQSHSEQLHNNFTRTHAHPGHQNLASNDALLQIPSNDDPYVQFGHIISHNSVVEPDFCEGRMQHSYSQQSQNFLTTGSNNLNISSHQQMPVNITRMFPMAPARLPVSFNDPPTWQHLHQPLSMPSNHQSLGHVYPPTLPQHHTLENQQSGERRLDDQPMPVLRYKEHHSDSSYETARDDHSW